MIVRRPPSLVAVVATSLPILGCAVRARANPAKEAFALARGQDSAALRKLRALAVAHPTDGQVLHALGRALAGRGKSREACRAFEASLGRKGSPRWLTGWNHYFLGLCLARIGKRKEGLTHLKTALDLKATRNCSKAAAKLWRALTGKLPPGFRHPLVGKTCPPVKLFDLAGRAVSLADFRGEVVALQIGATW